MTTDTAWADLVHGVAELEPTARGVRPHRLPAWARRRCPDPQLLGAEAQPSGVRVAFTTTATTVSLATHATRSHLHGGRAAARPVRRLRRRGAVGEHRGDRR